MRGSLIEKKSKTWVKQSTTLFRRRCTEGSNRKNSRGVFRHTRKWAAFQLIPFFYQTQQKCLRKIKNFANCENIFWNKNLNFNKLIVYYTTSLKSAEGNVKIVFPLKRPKFKSLSRWKIGQIILGRRIFFSKTKKNQRRKSRPVKLYIGGVNQTLKTILKKCAQQKKRFQNMTTRPNIKSADK